MTRSDSPVAEIQDCSADGPWARETAAWLRGAAAALGLPHLAFTPATELDQYERYKTWLAADYAGELVYLVREESQKARRDPRHLLESARCVCTVAVSYLHPADAAADADRSAADALRGQIARYARATDYHIVLKQRLGRLAEQLRQHLGTEVAYRVCVDTAPVL